MRALPTALSLSDAMKVFAFLPVFVAIILCKGPKAELSDQMCYRKPVVPVSCRAFTPTFYYMGDKAQERDMGAIFQAEEAADEWLDLSMLSLSEGKHVMDVEVGMPLNRQSKSQLVSIEHRGNSNGLLVVRVSAGAAYYNPVDWVDAVKTFARHRGCKRVLILGSHAVGVSVLYDSAYLVLPEKSAADRDF
jgi:hypothetical protein